MTERFYQLKIELFDAEPNIWRRFVVPASISMDRLHDVIQIVMGWEDEHSHEFTISGQTYTESPEEPEDGLEEGNHRLNELIKENGSTFSYLYDFDNEWEHQLILEKNNYQQPFPDTILECIDGDGDSPIEDIDMQFANNLLQNRINEETDEEGAAYLAWLEGKLLIAEFDMEIINEQLIRYLRMSRDRVKKWDC